MHGDLRRLVRPEDREKHFDREVRGTLARILSRLANQGDAILALPVAGFRLKVEADDAAAGCAVDHDNRCCRRQSGSVDHVAKPVKTTLDGEKFLCLQPGTGRKGVARPPRKMSISRHGDLVGVAQIQRPRVGILRTARDKSCAHLGDRYAQWLAAENQKIPAVAADKLRSPSMHRWVRKNRKEEPTTRT